MSPTHRRREDAPRTSRGHSRLRTMAVIATLIFASLGVVSIATAVPSSRPLAPDPAAFTAIDPQAYAVEPAPTRAPGPTEPPAAIPDFFGDRPLASDEAAERFAQPDVDADAPTRVLVKPTPTPRPQQRVASAGGGGGGGNSVRGTATWYCLPGVSACHYQYSGGMYAAAGPALRVGDWRGRRVTVCQGGECIRVRLIDWCGCPNGRVIDLYSDAFRQLEPLSSGTMRVTVRW
jgi:hypothetical protein